MTAPTPARASPACNSTTTVGGGNDDEEDGTWEDEDDDDAGEISFVPVSLGTAEAVLPGFLKVGSLLLQHRHSRTQPQTAY